MSNGDGFDAAAYRRHVEESAHPDTTRVDQYYASRRSANPAFSALIWITILCAIVGLVSLIGGASNMNVINDDGMPTSPGLPWLFIGVGLLGIAIFTGIGSLIAKASR